MNDHHTCWPQTCSNLYGFTLWDMQVFVVMRRQIVWQQRHPFNRTLTVERTDLLKAIRDYLIRSEMAIEETTRSRLLESGH